jgi:hypothetical protein
MVGRRASAQQNREGGKPRGKRGCSPKEGQGFAQGRRRIAAREGRSPAREETARDRERQWPESRKRAWPRARARKSFLKTGYGRTGQSTVPVRCTPDSAQENRFLARGCRCTGHCTVQCPVHTGLSGEPRQREVLKFLNFSI